MELNLNTCIQECALAHGTVPETEKLIYHFAMREKC